ncbi:conserved hypothetical protein [Paraburkholderia tropica]|nr:conserved hypothetical protein [Paraburkholderia tropica]
MPAARRPGYKGNHPFRRNERFFCETQFSQAQSAMFATKFYFYFFWYLRPLADREG